MKQGIRRFFKYARERHQIYLNRQAGLPRDKWTADPILQTVKFTNVFRELDKTTKWFATHVRDPLRGSPDVLLATVVFRLLNRIETGEAVFCDNDLLDKSSAFYDFMRTGKTEPMRRAIVQRIGKKGPYVTGAYIISSPAGYPKLEGMMEVLRRFKSSEYPLGKDAMKFGGDMPFHWDGVTRVAGMGHMPMQMMFNWLSQHDYLGKFHSYEIVTDLRHTALLENAPDRNTWCNVGPGARRGLNRVMGRDYKDHGTSTEDMLDEMRVLLQHAQSFEYWPQPSVRRAKENGLTTDDSYSSGNEFYWYDKKYWPAWEMREVEHTLCEFDKYERVRLGQGKPRGVYR